MRGPEMWRTTGQRLRLEMSNCPVCHIKHFPPRIICPDCGAISRTLFERESPQTIIGTNLEKKTS